MSSKFMKKFITIKFPKSNYGDLKLARFLSSSSSSSSSSSFLFPLAINNSTTTRTSSTASNDNSSLSSSMAMANFQKRKQKRLEEEENLYDPLAELDYQLNEVKVFQDEQIIQFTFKSGKSVNYTMWWLRNLCTCQECMSDKFFQSKNSSSSSSSSSSSDHKKLRVSRIRCDADSSEFEIDWIDNDYKIHTTLYDLKQLNNFNYKYQY